MPTLRHRVLNASGQPVAGYTATARPYSGNKYRSQQAGDPVFTATTAADGWLNFTIPADVLGRKRSFWQIEGPSGLNLVAGISRDAGTVSTGAGTTLGTLDPERDLVPDAGADYRSQPLTVGSPAYARTVAGTPPPPPPQFTAIDTFQAGHTWAFANNDAASSLARTTDPVIGAQYVRMVSQGLGAATPVRLTRTGLNLNMTGRKFALLMRITGTQNLDNVFLYAGSAGFAAYNLFQLDRYTDDRTKSWWREGEWAWMVFGHETLNVVTGAPPRGAYTDLRIAIVDKGAGGKVTADVAAIASVPEPGAATLGANGIVSFTCDDNWRSQFTTARPILDKYLFPATAYIIADAVGTNAIGGEGAMTLAELQQLQSANRWEIAAHASTLARHDTVGGFTALTAEQLDAEHLAMKSWLKDNGFFGYEHLAYPQGCYNPTVIDRTRAWYVSARGTQGYANESWPPNDVHRIRGMGLDVGITLAAAKTRVDKAVAGKGWLPIFFHKIGATADSLTWTTSDFTNLVDYVAASGAAVRTVGQVLSSR